MTRPLLSGPRTRRRSIRRERAINVLLAATLTSVLTLAVTLGSTAPAWACGLYWVVCFGCLLYALDAPASGWGR